MTQAWLVGGGGSTGLNATIGTMKADHNDKLKKVPSIQIVPAADYQGNIALRGGTDPTPYPKTTDEEVESHQRGKKNTLDLNHTHFVLVDKKDPRDFTEWDPVLYGVQNALDQATGRPIDTRGCEEDLYDLFIECACGGGKLAKGAVIPLVLIFYGGGPHVLSKCATTAAHGSGRSLYFIKWSGGCADMLSLFFEAHRHRSKHMLAERRTSTVSQSDAGEVRSVHAAQYDALTTQAEHALKVGWVETREGTPTPAPPPPVYDTLALV